MKKILATALSALCMAVPARAALDTYAAHNTNAVIPVIAYGSAVGAIAATTSTAVSVIGCKQKGVLQIALAASPLSTETTAGITVKFQGSKTSSGTYADISSGTATLTQSGTTARAWAPIDFDSVGYIRAIYWATNALNVDGSTTTLVAVAVSGFISGYK